MVVKAPIGIYFNATAKMSFERVQASESQTMPQTIKTPGGETLVIMSLDEYEDM